MNWRALSGITLALPFLLPLLLLLFAFVVVPVLGTLVSSFFQQVPFLETKVAFLGNYVRLARDPQFWSSARFTLCFAAVSVAIEALLGMLLALALTQKMRWGWLVKGTMLLPWAIPVAVGSRVWQLIYNYQFGLANFLATRLGLPPINWLGSPLGAFFALVVADVWKTTPFVALILFAGLQNIPDELHRQAMVDGANFFQRLFRITLPLLAPVMLVAVLFRSIDALRVFDLIYVLTWGGPGGTTTCLSLYAYRYFLLGDFGYGSAVSVVLFLLALGLSLLYLRVGRFREALA